MINQQNHVFIDSENCGSSVGYYINIDEYKPKDRPVEYSVASTVVFTDCSHKIDWVFGNDSVDKIDAAIQMLQEFRKRYVEATKMVLKLAK